MDMDFEKILLEELEKENVYCDGDLIEGRGAFDAVMKFAEKYHQSKVNNSVLDDVIKRFEVGTRVSWCKHSSPCFYVMEQKGKDVLICNTTNVEDDNYNDWWVDYKEINVL